MNGCTYQCVNKIRWNNVIPNDRITVDAVATAAMVRFGSDAELDVTENRRERIDWEEKKEILLVD